jgi:hypothetical protein
MRNRGSTSGFLRITEGFRSQKTSANACTSGASYYAWIEQSSFCVDISDWIWKKSYYIRLGSISTKGIKYRPQNIDFGSNRWPRQSDGGRFF